LILKQRVNIAVFASGTGTNTENLINYFKTNTTAKVAYVICNNPNALVLEKAKAHRVPSMVVDKDLLYTDPAKLINILKYFNISFIVLAGFNWLVPVQLLEMFPNKIVNIHPALLPKHGGKGMYGIKVHEAVKAANESETGITIHFVNEKYDEGQIIFQAKCTVDNNDTPEQIAQKVHQLEYDHYPQIIEKTISNS
jgi:phosphoribosylglycinamide formyltransferase 1